ncbi:unnamed protein product [Effrenium voratum]|nr:unnamed protein product [Effrenium voratum]
MNKAVIRHHLARVVWTERHLERLMAVMARQKLGEPPHQDDLRLRRAPGRMVIDVHFRDKAAPLGCVVEILNAYSSGRSQRSEVVELLRAASRAQQVQQAALQESTENLEAMRRSLARLDSEWADAKAAAEKRHRGLLQRFALVLQAKIDKERALHAEVQDGVDVPGLTAHKKPECMSLDDIKQKKAQRPQLRAEREKAAKEAKAKQAATQKKPAGKVAAPKAKDKGQKLPKGGGQPAGGSKNFKGKKRLGIGEGCILWTCAERVEKCGAQARRLALSFCLGGSLPVRGTVTQGITLPPPTMVSGPPTHSLFDPDSDEEPAASKEAPRAPQDFAAPAPAESVPRGPRRPTGLGTGDLFFSDSE